MNNDNAPVAKVKLFDSTVYVVMRIIPYEGEEIYQICATLQAAKNCIEQRRQQYLGMTELRIDTHKITV
jgi:hypothetical protein